jgi:hypothetical protein
MPILSATFATHSEIISLDEHPFHYFERYSNK